VQKRFLLPVFTGLAVLGCYASTLNGMLHQWLTDDDMGHGIVVPLVILWIVWRERARWRDLPAAPSPWGWLLLAAGAGLHLIGALGGGLFASSVALLISIAGVVVALGGFAYLRTWTFPFALALFMLPKLAIVYNQTTLPLQLMASQLAATLLTVTGFGVIRAGNVLEVRGHQILVAEACNGIRYLLPLGFVAALLGYLSNARRWTRWALVFAAVPVAILANAVRVAVSGAVPALAEGTLHSLAGVIIFVFSLALLGGVLHAFQRLSAGSHA
jgi:exosortase